MNAGGIHLSPAFFVFFYAGGNGTILVGQRGFRA